MDTPAISEACIERERHMELVTVGSFPTSAAAAIAKNLLDAEGIPTFLENEDTGDLFHLAASFGEVQLQVPADRESEALAILEAAQNHALTAEAAEEAEKHAHDPRDPEADDDTAEA